LVEILNKQSRPEEYIFQTIFDTANNGSRQDKLNTISLIDSFFKNGKNNLILALQDRVVKRFLDPLFSNEPIVHRLLCKHADEWVKLCKNQKLLTKTFCDWRDALFSFKLTYVMDQDSADKFSHDFAEAYELLQMFNRAIVEAYQKNIGPHENILEEILPNVNEVHQRLKELKPTIIYLINLCKCLDFLEEYL